MPENFQDHVQKVNKYCKTNCLSTFEDSAILLVWIEISSTLGFVLQTFYVNTITSLAVYVEEITWFFFFKVITVRRGRGLISQNALLAVMVQLNLYLKKMHAHPVTVVISARTLVETKLQENVNKVGKLYHQLCLLFSPLPKDVPLPKDD